MFRRISVFAAIAAVAVGGFAIADDAADPVKPVVAKKSAVKDACKEACSGCPISAAMKNLPQMTFLVGEEKSHCPKTAAKLAAKQGVPMLYVVGEDQFESKSDAQVALADATEAFVEEFATPCACKVSGTTTVAGKRLECSTTAAKLASLVSEAIDSVDQTYLVGDEKCSCPNQAEALAGKSGQKKLFVVGEEQTACPVTARLNLARAKYRAAVEAMVKAQQQAQASAPTESTKS